MRPRLAVFLVMSLAACGTEHDHLDRAEAALAAAPVGLSLHFRDGAPVRPLALPFEAPRFAQEIDVIASVVTPTDEGITPVTREGDLAGLDWDGIAFVEEDWRQEVDGTWTRQRFYRGAKWMTAPSVFHVVALDASGAAIGEPIVAHAGEDGAWKPSDDTFVRRFVGRQTARGCQAQGDCTNVAQFQAQALVQLRVALAAEQRAVAIPAAATALALVWTADPQRRRIVPVTRTTSPLAPGFQIELAAITPPANGSYYQPGDAVSFRITLRDGAGNRLHPEGALPTYGQFLRGEVASGIHYYDGFRVEPTLYYAQKHREAMLMIGLVGPTSDLVVPRATIDAFQLFLPQATTAEASVDGFTGIAAIVPSGAIVFGGLFDPAAWEAPVSDRVDFVIPDTAEPGTYVVSAKARREFGGEALNRATTTTIQIGTATPSTYVAKTGNCGTCHTGPTRLGVVGHGFTDRRACVTCHAPLSFEPDNALDNRIHMIHDRSNRFPGDMHACSTCHLVPPSGPGLGIR